MVSMYLVTTFGSIHESVDSIAFVTRSIAVFAAADSLNFIIVITSLLKEMIPREQRKRKGKDDGRD